MHHMRLRFLYAVLYQYLLVPVKLNGINYVLDGQTSDSGKTYFGQMLSSGNGANAIMGVFIANKIA